jgi:hypothetical protein
MFFIVASYCCGAAALVANDSWHSLAVTAPLFSAMAGGNIFHFLSAPPRNNPTTSSFVWLCHKMVDWLKIYYIKTLGYKSL